MSKTSDNLMTIRANLSQALKLLKEMMADPESGEDASDLKEAADSIHEAIGWLKKYGHDGNFVN